MGRILGISTFIFASLTTFTNNAHDAVTIIIIIMVRALVAKASGPGFESPATTKIFSHFSFAFFQTPLGDRKFQSSIIIIIH